MIHQTLLSAKNTDDDHRSEVFSQNFASRSNQHVASFEDCKNNGNVLKRLCKCLWMSLNIIVASIILIVFCTTIAYQVRNTTYSCMKWTYLWFPLRFIILFAWKNFKAKFSSTVFVCVTFVELTSVYYLILLQFDVYDSNRQYSLLSAVLFCASLLCCLFV